MDAGAILQLVKTDTEESLDRASTIFGHYRITDSTDLEVLEEALIALADSDHPKAKVALNVAQINGIVDYLPAHVREEIFRHSIHYTPPFDLARPFERTAAVID